MRPSISLVVAKAANGIIGNKGMIPWRLPEDMRHFKVLTMGKPCIMGRKTWESLPKKPLPGRCNIVITRDPNYPAAGAMVVQSFAEAVSRAEAERPEEIAVIGGADVYRAALPQARRIYLTEVHSAVEGDVFMPEFDLKKWRETARSDHLSTAPGLLAYSFIVLERAETNV